METATVSPTLENRTNASSLATSPSNSAKNASPLNGPVEISGPGDANTASAAGLPSRFSSGSYYAYSSEDFSLKYRSNDGDTVELTSHRESFEMMQWQSGSQKPDATSLEQNPGDTQNPEALDALQKKQDKWGKLGDLMQQVKHEMQQQQLTILKSLLGLDSDSVASLQGLWAKLAAARKASENGPQNPDQADQDPLAGFGGLDDFANLANAGDPATSNSSQYSLQVTVEEFHLKVEMTQNKDGEGSGVLPDYWNAENTSDRIANFALQFAQGRGADAEEFMTKIKDAIDLGFSQALGMTGPLPGNAGKVTDDTHRLTFEKLDRKLAEWQATPYNETVLNTPISAASDAMAGAHINLAA
jgi:hypothetical protein